MLVLTGSQLSVCFELCKDSTPSVQQCRWCSYQCSLHAPSSPHFPPGFVPITALLLLMWLPTNNSHTQLQQMPRTPGSTASRMSCLSSKTHNKAKSEQSQGDCNNQPKWLSEKEKSYYALCGSLKHFGDLESNCSALTKMFYKKQISSFCCLYRDAEIEEKYLT